VKATHGVYSLSHNGTTEHLPKSQADTLFDALQSDATVLGGGLHGVKALGSATVDGISVERYSAELPARAVQSRLKSLMSMLGSTSAAGMSFSEPPETLTVDLKTGAPVSITGAARVTFNLAALHKKGVSGVLVVTDSGTQTYSHVVPHASK
jgi:hypothetical protein